MYKASIIRSVHVGAPRRMHMFGCASASLGTENTRFPACLCVTVWNIHHCQLSFPILNKQIIHLIQLIRQQKN